MDRRGRSLFFVSLVALATLVVGVSVAWACVAPGFGTPSSPPPSSGDKPPADQPADAPSGTAPAPSGGSESEAAPAPAPDAPDSTPTGSADSRSVSGGGDTATEPRRGAPTPPASGGTRSPAVPATPGEQLAARESGATVGVVNEGGQPVFANTKPSIGKKAAGSGAAASSPSERSAVGDVWSGFNDPSAPGSTASVASPGENGGSGSALGMGILAVGLVGLLGTFFLLAASRRRRVTASQEGTGRGPSGQ